MGCGSEKSASLEAEHEMGRRERERHLCDRRGR